MPSHFKLKATIGGIETVGESLTMSGNNFSFKVSPVERNNGQSDIHSSVVLNHNNKVYSIALNHLSSTEDYQDPEPSIPKWSYVDDLRVSFNGWGDENPTKVNEEDAKSFQYGHLYVESGVRNMGSPELPTNIHAESIEIGFVFTTESVAEASLRHNCYDKVIRLDEESYEKICRFKMFYKLPTTDPVTGDPVIPTDDGTPASNRLRLPCKVEFIAPDLLIDPFIVYRIRVTNNNSEEVDTDYTDWDTFRSAWETVRLDTVNYSDVKFYGYIYSGVKRNWDLVSYVGPQTLIIQEVAQEVDGTNKIFGAKPLRIYITQLEVRGNRP